MSGKVKSVKLRKRLAASKDPLDKWRKQFPIVRATNYLISNSLGAMPKETAKNMAGYADTWATRGVRAWSEGWWSMAVDVGDLVARVLHAPGGSVTMHQNVTIASALVRSCFDFKRGRKKVVMVDMEFPSLLYLWHRWRSQGVDLQVVKSDDGVGMDTQKIIDSIDRRTALVPISHVLFKSAYIVDAKAIIEKAHKVGARVCLDVFQSAGTVPVNVKKLNVDFAVGGALKWLCGGPGASYLYVRPDLHTKLQPRFTGWQAHQVPFAFEAGPIRFREDGWRFLTGTPNIPALYAAKAGLEIVGSIGDKAIRKKSIRQTERLIALADGEGWEVTAPRDTKRRGGTVAINVPNGADVAAELNARDVVVDYRPGAGIRLSPHFYTRDKELDAAIGEMRDVIDSGAWKKHANKKKVVT
ncbi:MAG: aminotransferase class V-fold PLP-dependent enzyme [Planctomycetota bacterium]